MTEREALYAAVRANPAEDLPRMVLADWLDENGESVRAGLIREQIPRGIVYTIPDLFPSFGGWMGIKGEMVRGFVSGVEVPFSFWLTHAPAVLAESVELTVRLTDRPIRQTLHPEALFFVGDLLRVPLPSAGDDPRHPYAVPIEEHLRSRWPEVKTWELPPALSGTSGRVLMGIADRIDVLADSP